MSTAVNPPVYNAESPLRTHHTPPTFPLSQSPRHRSHPQSPSSRPLYQPALDPLNNGRMDQSTISTPPAADRQAHHDDDVSEIGGPRQLVGQNHDRIDAVMEDGENVVPENAEVVVVGLDHDRPSGDLVLEGEPMDTSVESIALGHDGLAPVPPTDDLSGEDLAQPLLLESSGFESTNASGGLESGAVIFRMPESFSRDRQDTPIPPAPANPFPVDDLLPPLPPPPDSQQLPSSASDMPAAAPSTPNNLGSPPAPRPGFVGNGEWESAPPRQPAPDTTEEDSDDESSSTDQHPYWAEFREDPSAPDEEELRRIEASVERSALDHEHWENTFYEALDDPEYVPQSDGRITWNLKGVNGTPENPNKERIMRSPAVLIGDHYWRIKFFPRGNEGTDYLSVYIECSKTPFEAPENSTPQTDSEEQIMRSESEGSGERISQESTSSDRPTGSAQSRAETSHQGQTFSEESQEEQASLDENDGGVDATWEIATQVGCVVYNPDEPRVHVSMGSAHCFCPSNADWGWTRFHGPWDSIHRRHPFQRQALLRNDTLSFTAYIRTVKDETRSLWWHAPKDSPGWNSYLKTGLKGLEVMSLQWAGVVPALSIWIHLKPFIEMIFRIDAPSFLNDLSQRKKPLVEILQWLLIKLHTVASPLSQSRPVPVDHVLKALEWHGVRLHSRVDVVAIWEVLRQILNEEGVEAPRGVGSQDLLQDIVFLKQPPQPEFSNIDMLDSSGSVYRKAYSVQETIDFGFRDKKRAFRDWEGFGGELRLSKNPPSVLQVELSRQRFDKGSRKWRKLTHKIELNETISTSASDRLGNASSYTLLGMIIHSGHLESQNYYSIIRPAGPGTRWFKYDGRLGKVTCLTRKQAVEAHEGSGADSEGTEAVAYVAIYVLTDALSSMLAKPEESLTLPQFINDRLPASALRLPGERIDPDLAPKDMTFYVYDKSLFEGYSEGGFFDSWDSYKSPFETTSRLSLECTADTTMSEIRGRVLGMKGLTIENACEIWALDITILNSNRWSPSLVKFGQEATMGEISRQVGGCQLCFFSPEVMPPTNVSTPTVLINAALELVRHPLGETRPQEDVIMEGTHDQDLESHSPPAADTTQIERPAPEIPVSEDHQYVLVLIKLFDHKNQTLIGVSSNRIPKCFEVGESLKLLLNLSKDKTYTFFHEYTTGSSIGVFLNEHSALDSFAHRDGTIIIVQEQPTENELAIMRTNGDCLHALEYLSCLRGMIHPSSRKDHYVTSQFGNEFFSASLKNGRPHGHGIRVDMDGNVYDGNFASSVRSGYGTMNYSNGNLYVGEWKDNEPDGQGKMIYSPTGNTYIGGWKKGRRSGKGTMHFEVADEELQICKICYEGEMNALLYDCGHVVACEECARQVDICPVCRRSVRGVVKIWRT